MQNLGFLYAMMPVLRRLYPQKEENRRAQVRHLELFNSQPYMTAPIMGSVVHLERQCAEGETTPEFISTFKKNCMSGFAALGDSLFWNTLRPLCAALSLVFAYRGHLWAPLVLLATYNGPHLYVRIHGFRIGLEQGLGLIREVQRWRIPDLVLRLRTALPVVLGVVLFQSVSFSCRDIPWGYGVLALPATAVCWVLLRRNIPPAMILLGIFTLSLAVCLVLER